MNTPLFETIAAKVLEWLSTQLSSVQFWLGVAVVAGPLLAHQTLRRTATKSVSINLPFGLGSATYDTTPSDRILAWKLYVQLITRKAALPFDPQCDVILEVYDSLFELFQITRNLLLEIPAREFERPQGLDTLMLRVLNDGVRPHLTKWQADYRAWHTRACAQSRNSRLSPQKLQRKYPRYTELLNDLARTNTELSKLANELRDIARKPRPSRRKTRVAQPEPPIQV
jgi:hypothetical protein